ncbi:MAG: hypothetical protein II920_02635, partial [Clostridia bacterium]|nr:hypothetical protein [Clostridia bacterium]
MKRTVCFILALMLVLMCASAQATASYVEHTHNWVAMDRTEPTCTEAGMAVEYCSICQQTRDRVLPALGHYYPPDDWEVIKEPTCTEPGVERNTCA